MGKIIWHQNLGSNFLMETYELDFPIERVSFPRPEFPFYRLFKTLRTKIHATLTYHQIRRPRNDRREMEPKIVVSKSQARKRGHWVEVDTALGDHGIRLRRVQRNEQNDTKGEQGKELVRKGLGRS